MRVYKFLNAKWGLKALEDRRLKIARISDLNDPFALFGINLSNREPGQPILLTICTADGEAAARDSWEREEFFIEHHHIFSMVSAALLFSKAGFQLSRLERLREPSTKYTIRAFLRAP